MIEHEPFQKKLYGRRKGPKLSAHKENLCQTLLPRLALNIMPGADPRCYFPVSVTEVWLEIGFGAGEHMLVQARANPDVGLIGAEPYESGVAKLLTHLADDPPANLRIHEGDARDILAALPDAARSQYTDAVTRSRVEEYMTAAYNGGPARVSKAMARWDEMWSSDPNNSITALRAKRQTVLAQISTFKSKVKKETVAAKKKQLKSQLAAAETLNNQLIDRIEYLKVSGLKAETLAYITKYRQVIDVIGDRAVAVAVAE